MSPSRWKRELTWPLVFLGGILVGAICSGTLLLADNWRHEKSYQPPQLSQHQALGECKIAALMEPNPENSDEITANFFDACMASKGYELNNIAMCYPPNHPAHNYVTGVFDLGSNGIDGCYSAVVPETPN